LEEVNEGWRWFEWEDSEKERGEVTKTRLAAPKRVE